MMLFLIFVGSLFLLINLILIIRVSVTYLQESFKAHQETESKQIDLSVFNKIS